MPVRQGNLTHYASFGVFLEFQDLGSTEGHTEQLTLSQLTFLPPRACFPPTPLCFCPLCSSSRMEVPEGWELPLGPSPKDKGTSGELEQATAGQWRPPGPPGATGHPQPWLWWVFEPLKVCLNRYSRPYGHEGLAEREEGCEMG